MKLLFSNMYRQVLVPLKRKMNKIIKKMQDDNDDHFSNPFLIF
jgi:hypothetical protein